MWSLRVEASLDEKLHWLHLCGFSPVWMRKWVFKMSALPNDLLHCEQLYLLPPLWVCLCLQRPPLPANVLGHWSQDFRSAIFCFKLFPLTLFHDDWGNHDEHKLQLMVDHFPFHKKLRFSLGPSYQSWRLSYLSIKIIFDFWIFVLFIYIPMFWKDRPQRWSLFVRPQCYCV